MIAKEMNINSLGYVFPYASNVFYQFHLSLNGTVAYGFLACWSMKNNQGKFLVALLMVISMMALSTNVFAPPQTYAQSAVQSKTTHKGPDTATTTQSSEGNGRHGHGVPPGLLQAWAHSNMSIVARAVTHAIFLNGTHGVELAEIAINASSNGQLIENIATNESVAQIEFDHDGAVELHVNSTDKPTAVYADDSELTEVEPGAGMNMTSNTWAYDQNSHMLTVDADPASITIIYGTSATPVLEFPSDTTIAVITLVAVASALFIFRRVRESKAKLTF